ncbi:MAG TPA: hypothetical protein VFP87_01885, partial [Chitinophagaceae bacterium]|nr:hypothetical protein [Chitinophagaceae bacterium]
VVMHGEWHIGDSVVMFADTTDEIGAKPAGIFIYVENVDETYKKALAMGANSLRAPTQQPTVILALFAIPLEMIGGLCMPGKSETVNSEILLHYVRSTRSISPPAHASQRRACEPD